jgi:hypothetical protein
MARKHKPRLPDKEPLLGGRWPDHGLPIPPADCAYRRNLVRMKELEGKPRQYKLYADDGKRYTVIQVSADIYHSVNKRFAGRWDGIILRGNYISKLEAPEPSLQRPTQGRKKRTDGLTNKILSQAG